MHTVGITQIETLDAGWFAKLTISAKEFEIEIQDPFAGDQREKRLEWYFEEWIRFPFSDTTLAAKAAASVKEYGTSLFRQIFGDPHVHEAYRNVSGNLGDLEIVIQGDPGFQSLHWEAMWDEEIPRPMAIDCIMVRQLRGNKTSTRVFRRDSALLNLLVVTARPHEENDVGYRTISRPLVEAIETACLPVNVDFVRPGTYEAFVKQLEARQEGFYHLVHFDVHGGLMTSDQFRSLQHSPLGNHITQRGYGLQDLPLYEGVQAFLFFEGDEAGMEVAVTAQEMSDRLSKYRIPACVLNACESGKQRRESLVNNSGGDEESVVLDSRETSLGARLMDAGMQMVVAMAYSVTVDAARLLVTQLYGELFGSVSLERALQKARRELYARKGRSVYFGQRVELEDWLLPVVYRNGVVDLKLRRMYPEEETEYFTRRAMRFQFGNQFATEYGFVGRDLEILKIEKRLIRNGNVLMLYGMGGTGKTTLLRYLQDWWVQTGFVEGVSYFGYDQRAWKLEQILFTIAQDVMTEVELRSFQSMPTIAQIGKLVQVLKTRRWLVVLDNLESVTGQALAIQNTLSESEQAGIRDFLIQIKRGQSRVLLGSRRREDWLGAVYGGNEYELRGLDDQARSQLAEKVLERHVKDGAKRRSILADKDFARLMKLLAGYPLAIEVILSNLARQSVAEVLAGLDAADVSLDRVGNKTESILQCVEYSHGNLSESAQRSLLCLALFSGFIVRGLLEQYVDELKKSESFKDYRFEDLDAAVTEAINWGLLTPHEMGIPDLLTIQPVFPYFLKTKLAKQDDGFRSALRLGFKNHYEGLAGSYQQLMQSKEAQEKQLGQVFCKLEYENLYAALQIALERQESPSIFLNLDFYHRVQNDTINRFPLALSVCEILKNYPETLKSASVGAEIIAAFNRLSECYLNLQKYEDAGVTYSQTLTTLDELRDVDDQWKQLTKARTYHQLGMVAQALREFEQARNNYQQALQIFIEFGDRSSQASTYHQLGIVAQDLREFEQARNDYQQALQIKIEFGDRYSQADTYHQLGRVSHELREFEQARNNYQQALQIKIEFGDRYGQASTYHELGTVAQELREFEQSRNDYQQALQICIEFGDRYMQASIYHNLGIAAYELHELEQARNDYQQALQICIEFSDHYSQARTHHELGMVAQELREYEQARNDYQQALQIYIEYNDRYSQARTYHQLGRVAEELREYEQARNDYQQALQIFIEYNDRYSPASTYHQLGIVAEELKEFEESGSNYLKALHLYVEYNDQHSLGIVFRSCKRLYQSHPSDQLLNTIGQAIGCNEAEVLQWFEQL